jgi:hypothetical protein
MVNLMEKFIKNFKEVDEVIGIIFRSNLFMALAWFFITLIFLSLIILAMLPKCRVD